MSAPVSVMAERRQLPARLGDLIYGMIVAAARADQAAPTYITIIAEARRHGLTVTATTVKDAIGGLVRAGRVGRVGRTNHQGYSLPGTDLRTQSSCQDSGYRRLGAERTSLRCPTLEERAEMLCGQRYEDVPHTQGRYVSINPFLEAHGWASPLSGE